MEYVCSRGHSGLRGAWRKSLDFLVLEGRLSVAFFLFIFASRKTKVSDRGFDSRGCVPFFFSFCVEEKPKVSDREFDSRGRHSACETVIAVHMVK